MHFFAVHIELGEEPHIRRDVVWSQVAPLSQEISDVAVVEIVTSQDIISKGAINSETVFAIAVR